MGYEQEIFAQVSTEYRDYSNSKLSAAGGGAFTPAIDSAPEPHIWKGWYRQRLDEFVVDETDEDEGKEEMTFDFFSITDEVVTGQGSDVVGYFTLQGRNTDGSVSFKKQYPAHDDYYVMYEAELTNQETAINGKWQIFDAISHERNHRRGTWGPFHIEKGVIATAIETPIATAE